MRPRIPAALGGFFLMASILLAACPPQAAAQGLTSATKGVPLPGKGPRAYLAIVIDDLPNLALWSKLASDSDAYGIKTTLAVNTAKATADDYAVMAKHVANGHEIANHTRDHVPVAPGDVIRLRYYNPAAKSAYAAVDPAAAKLRIFVDSKPEPVAEYDLSEKGPTPNLKTLVEALNNTRGVTAELVDPYDANIHAAFLSKNDRIDIFFKNGLVPLYVDVAPNARYEMENGKKDIEAGLPGYACTSMVYPFLVADAVSRKITSELGMNIGRVGPAGNVALGAPDGYNLYRVFAEKPRDLFGTNPASPEFKAKLEAFLKKLDEVGGVGCLYSHGPGEFTNEQWEALLPMLAKHKEIAFVTLRDLAKYVTTTATLKDSRYYLTGGGGK